MKTLEELGKKERDRICNLTREELIHEMLEDMPIGALLDMTFSYVYDDFKGWSEDTLRYSLIEEI